MSFKFLNELPTPEEIKREYPLSLSRETSPNIQLQKKPN